MSNLGRPKGSPNKTVLDVRTKAEELGVDPFEILLLFAKGDWASLGYKSEQYICKSGKDGDAFAFTIDPSVRAKCASEATQYLFAKRKALEVTNNNALDGMTPEQKLEAMRHAVEMLETKLKHGG